MKMSLVVNRIDSLNLADLAETISVGMNPLMDEGTAWDKDRGARFLANPDNALFIAFWDGVVAGYLSAHRLQRFDERDAEVLIYEVSVHEAYRQRGIGSALIAAVNAWGKAIGADQVWVLTNPTNLPAMALYQATGGEADPETITMFTYYV